MPGEAVPKHVAVLSITGRDFKVDNIRLKTVRPFVMREIVLSEEKDAIRLAMKANNRPDLTRFLEGIVKEMIEQANQEWEEAQGDEEQDEEIERPLPLIRLRVEYSAPDGGNFDCENPQRFSNRFVGKVANVNDVVQFHRKKTGGIKRAQNGAEMPEESLLASLVIDSVKVEKLVKEFLTAQSLTILPQNSFGDAVSQFVDKDDKHAMELFVSENLVKQVEQLMNLDNLDEDNIRDAMDKGKSHLEELFASGHMSKIRNRKRKPRPEDWDSDLNGEWDVQPAAIIRSDLEDEADSDETAAKPPPKGRGKAAPKKTAAPARKAAPAKSTRGKKKMVESESEEEEEEEEDVVMVDSGEDESQLFVKPAPPSRAKKAAAAKEPVAKRAPARGAAKQASKQSQLDFSRAATQSRAKAKKVEVSDDEISDEDDAFEPAPPARSTRNRR